MVVVEKGYHANGRERTRPSPCLANLRIAGTIAHGTTTESISRARTPLSLALSVNANGTGKFLKKKGEKGRGRGRFAAKFVSAALVLHERELTVRNA